jgi:hypothetical protein
MKHGLAIGDQIRNSASIYFDYNAPIKTNTTINTIWWNEAVPEINNSIKDNFQLFPNPANNSFTILLNNEYASTAQMNVTDITGRVIISKQLTLIQGNQNITTAVNQLIAGVYFVTLNADGIVGTQKLVILR